MQLIMAMWLPQVSAMAHRVDGQSAQQGEHIMVEASMSCEQQSRAQASVLTTDSQVVVGNSGAWQENEQNFDKTKEKGKKNESTSYHKGDKAFKFPSKEKTAK